MPEGSIWNFVDMIGVVAGGVLHADGFTWTRADWADGDFIIRIYRTPDAEPPTGHWGPRDPGHTDLMVTPESLDVWLDQNPLPRPCHAGTHCPNPATHGIEGLPDRACAKHAPEHYTASIPEPAPLSGQEDVGSTAAQEEMLLARARKAESQVAAILTSLAVNGHAPTVEQAITWASDIARRVAEWQDTELIGQAAERMPWCEPHIPGALTTSVEWGALLSGDQIEGEKPRDFYHPVPPTEDEVLAWSGEDEEGNRRAWQRKNDAAEWVLPEGYAGVVLGLREQIRPVLISPTGVVTAAPWPRPRNTNMTLDEARVPVIAQGAPPEWAMLLCVGWLVYHEACLSGWSHAEADDGILYTPGDDVACPTEAITRCYPFSPQTGTYQPIAGWGEYCESQK
jgi:hypothetical protein